MAKNGELPSFFAKPIGQTREGLFVTVFLTALLIIFLNLLQIAAVGSITVLFIDKVTHLGHLKVIQQTKASKFLVVSAFLTTFAVIVLFLIYSIKESYTILYLFVGIIALSFLIEIIIRSITNRKVVKGSEVIFRKFLNRNNRTLQFYFISSYLIFANVQNEVKEKSVAELIIVCFFFYNASTEE
jgi:hypothetical protein